VRSRPYFGQNGGVFGSHGGASVVGVATAVVGVVSASVVGVVNLGAGVVSVVTVPLGGTVVGGDGDDDTSGRATLEPISL